ncbi:hypothetical protein HJ01_02232 [Flavobacterium frigoris PS1]|uniref:Uncharacterized protein n=1 Tax=Flavobacterium frigoris (strain PS1) TaxID=1086011 RepID=H7FTN1_FLAFP|nr:hypothetical protein HJ01_02232 [Flavobacterium frigoris PS1]
MYFLELTIDSIDPKEAILLCSSLSFLKAICFNALLFFMKKW